MLMNVTRFKTDEGTSKHLEGIFDSDWNKYSGNLNANEEARKYFKESGLSRSDQEYIDRLTDELNNKESVGVNGSVIDTCKQDVNAELTFSKQSVINKLRLCNYRTSPLELSLLLEDLFAGWGSKNGHWLYVSQLWNPRAINRVIFQMIKQHKRGEIKIKNPAAYFTDRIKRRKKRRNIISSNGTC